MTTFEPIQGFADCFVIVPRIFEDSRGIFIESYNRDLFKESGINVDFVLDNHSISKKHVLRGLHFQWDPPMGKLMRVTAGKAFLVAVDIRKNSPSIGKWFGVEADAANRKIVYAPAGFARGFVSLEDGTEVQYKCSGAYNPKAESGIRFNDPEIGITWPIESPVVSEKDMRAQTLAEWLTRPESDFFKM